MTQQARADRPDDSPRERIVASAYELFARRGIREVAVDDIVRDCGIAKATLYRHFRSKNQLALAFLERREQLWTQTAVEAEARRRGSTPVAHLLAIFDIFDEWFARDDFEACSFINVLVEMGSGSELGRASVGYLSNIRDVVQRLATDAGLTAAGEFAKSWHILMKGSIISAMEGDRDAAKRARRMAEGLIAAHQPAGG